MVEEAEVDVVLEDAEDVVEEDIAVVIEAGEEEATIPTTRREKGKVLRAYMRVFVQCSFCKHTIVIYKNTDNIMNKVNM